MQIVSGASNGSYHYRDLKWWNEPYVLQADVAAAGSAKAAQND